MFIDFKLPKEKADRMIEVILENGCSWDVETYFKESMDELYEDAFGEKYQH